MTWLHISQEITAPRARLIPAADGGPPFAAIQLHDDPDTTLTFTTRAQAHAMRDACQQAGDMLPGAEGTTP